MKEGMKVLEVIIEYFDKEGRKITQETTGVIEGTQMYNMVGNLFDPNEYLDVIPTGAIQALMSVPKVAEESPLSELLDLVKKLSDKETKTFIQRALKLSEETGEVAEAVLSYMDAPGCGYKKKEESDVVEESIDVIIMALSIIFKTTASDEDVLNTFRTKLAKWESKMEAE